MYEGTRNTVSQGYGLGMPAKDRDVALD